MNYKSLEEISADVIKCKKCDLYKTRNNSVPGKGKKGIRSFLLEKHLVQKKMKKEFHFVEEEANY